MNETQNTEQKKTHYFKISNGLSLKKLIPKMDQLVLVGTSLIGRSPEKVEPGLISQSVTAIAKIAPYEPLEQATIDDLAQVPLVTPEALMPRRGWIIRDLVKEPTHEPMDTDCGDQDEITPDTIITGVSRGDVASLVSAGGLGKSFLTLQTLVNMACGRESLLTTKPKERRVVYLSLEDSMLNVTNRYKRVYKRMLESEEALPNGLKKDKLKWKLKQNLHVFSLPLVLIDSKGNQYPERIFDLLQNIPSIDLLVIDTARRIQDLNENDSGQMSSFLRLLEAIGTELNCATLLLHHSSKSGTLSKAQGVDVGASVARGSGAIVDNGRGTWVMCKLPKKVAEEHGIEDKERGDYVLLEHEKCNFEKAQPKRILQRSVGGLLQAMVPVKDHIEGAGEGSNEDENGKEEIDVKEGSIFK